MRRGQHHRSGVGRRTWVGEMLGRSMSECCMTGRGKRSVGAGGVGSLVLGKRLGYGCFLCVSRVTPTGCRFPLAFYTIYE